jgi:hypothetical protein|tara:strand:+ start:289 stop:468 length:180 start_codon:yes stop_codon:yes gene_type:complete
VRRGRIDVEVGVDVFVQLSPLEEERERVAARIGAAHLEHFHRVVGKVVVQYEGTQLAVE